MCREANFNNQNIINNKSKVPAQEDFATQLADRINENNCETNN
jgi:hypothetical protein